MQGNEYNKRTIKYNKQTKCNGKNRLKIVIVFVHSKFQSDVGSVQ